MTVQAERGGNPQDRGVDSHKRLDCGGDGQQRLDCGSGQTRVWEEACARQRGLEGGVDFET